MELTRGTGRIETEEKRGRHRRHLRKPHPQLAIELRDRIFVPRDAVDISDGQAGCGQAPPKRIPRQRRIVLDAGKAFFLCRRHQAAADQDATGRVVKMRRKTNDDGFHCGAAGENAGILARCRWCRGAPF